MINAPEEPQPESLFEDWPLVVSVNQAAVRMNCSTATVRRLCRAGKIQWRPKAGGTGEKIMHMEVNARSVDDWIIARRHARYTSK